MGEHKLQIVEGVAIEGMSSDGRGLGKLNGKVIFAPFTAPGDLADLEIRKSKKNFGEAVIANLISPSDKRTAPSCSHFGVCGGCQWQHIQYKWQLKFKQQIVEDAFSRIGKLDFPSIPEVIGCENDYYYRNKLEFAFTDRRWLTQQEIESSQNFEHRNGVGFHVHGNFMGVLDVNHCFLQADPSNQIRIAVRDFALANQFPFFNLGTQEGFLRNMTIRTTSTGEVLVLISFREKIMPQIEKLLDFLHQTFPQITSLQYVINTKRNDTIYDLDTVVYKGRDHIIESLGKYKFKIGPKSFFQTNSKQAKALYDLTKNFAGLTGNEVVYDLYTGVGSIAIYISDRCKEVTGIEQVESAIKDAKQNALLNDATNCSFIAGDVRMTLQPGFIKQHGRPDVIITDPPRAGMHEDVVKTLLQLEAPRIVYVSCNPATQARDLQLLNEKYTITRVQPVDMFPQTTHIENIAKLELK